MTTNRDTASAALQQQRVCNGKPHEVPPEVFNAVSEAFYDDDRWPLMPTREEAIERLAVIMERDKWRFCKCYRHNVTPAFGLIWSLIPTVQTNFKADEIAGREPITISLLTPLLEEKGTK